ncbi:hypothetical protein Airi02_021660 [Actinoallomurus iriomotensis]|uniref:Uncharacterized protein n=1 Tax=Actinoallomurus iriomotensis TaxID=478107 RepID=A0A9W6S1V3_9ACTN|nr:hypothetical protein Airi02_021660 [Actinoallomurus iriomotensis]
MPKNHRQRRNQRRNGGVRRLPEAADAAIQQRPDFVEPGDTVAVARDHPRTNTIKRRTHPVALCREVILIAQHKGAGEPLLGRPLRGREAIVALPRPTDTADEASGELDLNVGQMDDARALRRNVRPTYGRGRAV